MSLYAAFSSIYDCGTSTTMVDSSTVAAFARAEGATFCRFGRGIVQAYSDEFKLLDWQPSHVWKSVNEDLVALLLITPRLKW